MGRSRLRRTWTSIGRPRRRTKRRRSTWEKYGCRSIPVCKDDEVKVMTGKLKGREGRVVTVYRKRFHILVERLNRLKSDNQTEAPVPVHPSNVMITKIRETGSRRAILDRRGKDSADMD